MQKNPREVADGVLFLRTLMANVYVVRTGASWVLVDAGLPGYAPAIRAAAAAFVGSTTPPTAIGSYTVVATTHAPAAVQVELGAGETPHLDLRLGTPAAERRRPAHAAREQRLT